jgi:hypothetical protein
MGTAKKTMEKRSTGKFVSRNAKSGRFTDIGGTEVRVASPVTSLSSKKQAAIRAAVREYYADKKRK